MTKLQQAIRLTNDRRVINHIQHKSPEIRQHQRHLLFIWNRIRNGKTLEIRKKLWFYHLGIIRWELSELRRLRGIK